MSEQDISADTSVPTCATCDAPATCYGTYEGVTGYGCDTCCGHGCEDGECSMLNEEDA